MQPKLLHIYGPLFINSYGIAIAIGLLILVYKTSKDKILKKYLTADQLYALIMLGICSGIVGGRALYLATNWEELTHWYDIFAVWQGGLSITGVILSVLTSTCVYLQVHAIPLLPVTDRFVLYAPLAQAFGRLGCFVAGCCYGTFCDHAWAVTYTHRDVFAPLHVPLHPTQLYSAILLFCLFIFLCTLSRRCNIKTGQLTFLYLLCAGLERFVVDFWRGDRTFFADDLAGLSIHQLLSGGIVIIALIALIANQCRAQKK